MKSAKQRAKAKDKRDERRRRRRDDGLFPFDPALLSSMRSSRGDGIGYLLQRPDLLYETIQGMRNRPADYAAQCKLLDRSMDYLSGPGLEVAHPYEAAARGLVEGPLPGFLQLLHIDDDGEPSSEILRCLEPWDANLDRPVEALSDAIAQATKSLPLGTSPPNLALWYTGFFNPQTPVHVIVSDMNGTFAWLLMQGESLRPMPMSVLMMALDDLRGEHMVAGPISGMARHAGAFARCSRALVDLSEQQAALSLEHADDQQRFSRRVEELLDEVDGRVASQVAERMQAERAEKEIALTAAQACALDAEQRGRDLATQLDALRRQLADRLAASPAGAASPLAGPLQPAVLQPDFDEQSAYLHETIAHQAEVIRQLRVSLQFQPIEGDRIAADESQADQQPRRAVSDLGSWAAANADRVIVLKRALHAAKKSPFEDGEFFFAALDILANTYRDVKLGQVDRMSFKDACDRIGLDYGGSIAEAPGEEYFFNWGGRRVFLDQHIGRGISRDPRYCFRAYFTWDADEGKVIIGWTPGHLATRTT